MSTAEARPSSLPVRHWAVEGAVDAPAIVLGEPLSFWGGFDPADGSVIDRHHPRHGEVLTGRVVVMRVGRGSSSASSVIAEAIRAGTAPAALVMVEADPIVVLGAVVAEELYDRTMPIALVDDEALTTITDGQMIRLTPEAIPNSAQFGAESAPDPTQLGGGRG